MRITSLALQNKKAVFVRKMSSDEIEFLNDILNNSSMELPARGAQTNCNDLLNPQVRAEIAAEIAFGPELDLFTLPFNNTITINGAFDGVLFHEETLSPLLCTNSDVVIIKSNYTDQTDPSYQPYQPPKRSNRGRKKKPKKPSVRPKQGTGNEFNSQISFYVRSRVILYDSGVEKGRPKLYKFKIFRTGKIQLPGARNTILEDVIESLRHVQNVLECALKTSIIPRRLSTDLKNYRFDIRMRARNGRINLANLKMNLQLRNNDNPPHFSLTLNHDNQQTKLAVIFATPIFKDPNRATRVNIYASGKVNVLGAYNVNDVGTICTWLHFVIKSDEKNIIVVPGIRNDYMLAEDLQSEIF